MIAFKSVVFPIVMLPLCKKKVLYLRDSLQMTSINFSGIALSKNKFFFKDKITYFRV